MPEQNENDIVAFITTLPYAEAARTFLERLESLPPRYKAEYRLNPLLLSRLLTIAAYSPFLAEELLRHPYYIDWLEREIGRDFEQVKSSEQLSEDLARFVVRILDAEPRTKLARFKRRELLRTYLRDCTKVATLSEVTEELSNLADVILDHALALAHQEMVNLHGTPLTRDERGRLGQSELAIVALGKLGCRELNYASDIDLLFLYCGVGETAGDGRRRESVISNKEFFTGVANRVAQIIGSTSGEGAVYRTDLRLRPYGRDGDLVWEVERAASYYHTTAHNWERQALIRARASAGSHAVVARFLDLVRDVVFAEEALPNLLADVRRAKEKIDRQMAERSGGFNVKLGTGGIREVEFIAQALQLMHGGREPWLRSAQTLIILARLAEKGLLSESERARLSAAYTFLRTAEHRLQMEHGVQTHRLPVASRRLELLARRCGHKTAAAFMDELEAHTSSVRAVYNRVFSAAEEPASRAALTAREAEQYVDDETERFIKQAAWSLCKLIERRGQSPEKGEACAPPDANQLEQAIAAALGASVNPLRSLRNLIAWAESLATYEDEAAEATRQAVAGPAASEFIEQLIVVLSSHYLSHILISRPMLAAALTAPAARRTSSDLLTMMRAAISGESTLATKIDALRRTWYRLVMEIGYRDLKAQVARLKFEASNFRRAAARLRENNLEQTALAEAALHLSLELALEAIDAQDMAPAELGLAVMGLGRLGHSGMDYGSDLDLLIVFDDGLAWPPARLEQAFGDAGREMQSPSEFYAKLASALVRVLSSVTREGFLYRVDLRLRPDGQSGPPAQGLTGLIAYLYERASAWEHSAYLKAREVAGDLEFGKRAREAICETIFDAARRNPSLKEDMASMRTRLEKEKARGDLKNIKWGPGGMTDVYFITRYLQLRDRVYFPPERGTLALIAHLGERGSLTQEMSEALLEGYSFLRTLDHWMRLLLDRPRPQLPASQVALGDIARSLGLNSVEEFARQYDRHTTAIREAYLRILG
jgi:glutamate-ammonia-ligase adenylyltransferase